MATEQEVWNLMNPCASLTMIYWVLSCSAVLQWWWWWWLVGCYALALYPPHTFYHALYALTVFSSTVRPKPGLGKVTLLMLLASGPSLAICFISSSNLEVLKVAVQQHLEGHIFPTRSLPSDSGVNLWGGHQKLSSREENITQVELQL